MQFLNAALSSTTISLFPRVFTSITLAALAAGPAAAADKAAGRHGTDYK